MKFTFNWLKEFVTFKASPEKLAEMLTMAGLEVESLSPLHDPETNREDWLFEISVTPNRGDCLGITGLSNEVSFTGGREIDCRESSFPASSIANRLTIAVKSRLCPLYSAAVVDEVHIEPSPAWMRFRLEACDAPSTRCRRHQLRHTNRTAAARGRCLRPTCCQAETISPVYDSTAWSELAAGVICDGDVPMLSPA
jgi:hypothetical protein